MIIAIMNLARLQISESTNALMDLIKEENLIHYKVCTLLGLAICLNPSTPKMDPFGATVDVPAPILPFFFLWGVGEVLHYPDDLPEAKFNIAIDN